MKTIPLGTSDLHSSRLIYGCMRLPDTWDPAEVTEQREREAFAALEAAVEVGYTHFDNADIYCRGECERILGAFLKANPGLRERSIVTTKVGIRFARDTAPDAPHRHDFEPEYIIESCEGSLRRLGLETIDLYLLHRYDRLMDPDAVAGAFDKLHRAGKVRHFGVSNFSAGQMALLQSRLDQPLINNQVEVHPLRIEPFEDGTLDYCHQHRITPTSWSPIAGGRLGDPTSAKSDAPARLLNAIDREAAACGVGRVTLLLAWLLRHGSGMLPIVGSRQPERIKEAAAADEIELSREAWYRIYIEAYGKVVP